MCTSATTYDFTCEGWNVDNSAQKDGYASWLSDYKTYIIDIGDTSAPTATDITVNVPNRVINPSGVTLTAVGSPFSS